MQQKGFRLLPAAGDGVVVEYGLNLTTYGLLKSALIGFDELDVGADAIGSCSILHFEGCIPYLAD